MVLVGDIGGVVRTRISNPVWNGSLTWPNVPFATDNTGRILKDKKTSVDRRKIGHERIIRRLSRWFDRPRFSTDVRRIDPMKYILLETLQSRLGPLISLVDSDFEVGQEIEIQSPFGPEIRYKITDDPALEDTEVVVQFAMPDDLREAMGQAALLIEGAIGTLRDSIAAGTLDSRSVGMITAIHNHTDTLRDIARLVVDADDIRKKMGLDGRPRS